MAGLNLFHFLLKQQNVICFSIVTVFILISAAQPRISAHPVIRQKQLISTQPRISTHPHHTFLPFPLKLKQAPAAFSLPPPPKNNKIEQVLIRNFPEDGVFFSVLQKLALSHLRVLLLQFNVLLQNMHIRLLKMVNIPLFVLIFAICKKLRN